MKTEIEIMNRIRDCELAIRNFRMKHNEHSRQMELNALIERNSLKWVLK